jgi:hypothetical protein
MPTMAEYEKAIRKLKWPGLQALWNDIIEGTMDPWWAAGKAFEYLVIRMFELDHASVTYPYSVQLFGHPVAEQIDGSVRFAGLHCLVESKDESDNIAIEPIAKLRNQLLRRPSGTIGFVFSTTKFTETSVMLTQFAMPQAILLWTRNEVHHALQKHHICKFALEKYRFCVEHGMVDYDISST